MADALAINVQQAAKATPAVYTVPGAVDVEPLSAFAHFDGTGAASSFRPTLTFYSDAGLILARVFPSATVAAGDTADVTFAPFLGGDSSTSTTVFPVGTTLDYAEAPAGLFSVTATTPATANLWIQGNAVAFDGVTTAKITVWAALGTTDRDLVLELYMDGVDQGRIGQLSPSAYTFASTFIGIGHVVPSAGSHTFAIHAWKTVAGAIGTLLNPAPFPAVAFQPSFMEVTVSNTL